MIRFLIVFLFCITGSFRLFAQRDLIRFSNLTIDNGLAQGSVTGIVHGKDGYIWIATADGLHRYDGYNFKIFRNDPTQKQSLPDNYIQCLFEDSEGNLLLGFYSGVVAIMDKRNAGFRTLNIRNRKGETVKSPVNCIQEQSPGAYLIGYDGGGMVRYEKRSGLCKQFVSETTPGLGNNQVKCISKDEFTGNFWIGTGQGLYFFNSVNQLFSGVKNLAHLNSMVITAVLVPQPENMLIGTYGRGLYAYRRGMDTAERVVLPKSKGSRFITFLMDQPDKAQTWIGTLGGVYKWKDGKFAFYSNNPSNPESLVDNNTQTMHIDRFGAMWIGTINGLSRFDSRLKLFNLFNEFKWKDTLLNNNVYCIYEDPQRNLWMGTLSSGILKFDPQSETITAWPVIRAGQTETRMVRAIYKDRSGVMWIGSRDGGLFRFYPEKGLFVQVKGAKGYEISSPTIRCIYEDREGTLWIGTANGLNRYDRTTNRFEVFLAFKDAPNNNSIYQISESNDGGSLYLACFRGGFQIFNKQTRRFRLYKDLINDRHSAGKSYAMCFEMLGKDSVMIGTYGGGLCLLNLNNGAFRNITERQGLANNAVYGILRFGEQFWLSTNRGLSCYNKATGEIRNFGLKNYLQSNEYNEGAYCKTADGTFYFGGVHGFNYFKPDRFPTGTSSSLTEITAIRKGDTEVNFLYGSNGTRYIELNYNDNLISFEFATLNYLSSQSNRYAYKLEGFDDKWVKAGNRTVAYYTKLAPGKYVFRVKPMSGDKISSGGEAFLNIIIDPPFWRTWWFYLLMLLVVIGLVVAIIRWRTRAIDREYRHKLAELELKALRSQMNPHFIFNSLNSIQYFILKKEPRSAYDYLTKFSNLMRMILQNSKLKSITLKAEYEWLITYLELENLRMEGTLNYNVHLEENLHPDKIYVPTMVLQPYVENAIIHGLLPKKEGERILNIKVFAEGQKLKCVIEDNGIGRAESQNLNKARLKNYESTAMNLTRDRLAILNIETGEGLGPLVTDLYDANQKPAGTRVELTLPLIFQNEPPVHKG